MIKWGYVMDLWHTLIFYSHCSRFCRNLKKKWFVGISDRPLSMVL